MDKVHDLAAAPSDLRRDLAGAPIAFRLLSRVIQRGWSVGAMTFQLPGGREVRLEGQAPGPQARVVVHDYRFVRRVLASGAVGFAEGYMAGEWDTPDLSVTLAAFSTNADSLERLLRGASLIESARHVGHLLRPNSRKGSQKNIHAHYDLGNSFYELWLDPSMTYSSAKYGHAGEPLEAAQRRKYATLAQGLELRPDHHLLEIGCGWGGFAEFATREIGARITAITISREQFDFAKKRLFDQGLNEKAEVRYVDYRDVEGQFDRVASIEMFEAVGEKYWPAYFDKVSRVLAPGGRAGLQIITIRDELFGRYRKSADFIQKYVFPGGMLPSEQRLRQETSKAGLAWNKAVRFGPDYAETLAEWGRRFEDAWDQIRSQGFDERFRRLWRFYLSYCEAGFRTGRTDVVQLTLAKA